MIRFINEEDALLSPANGRAAGACMYVNVEDFVKYNRHRLLRRRTKSLENEPFLRVVPADVALGDVPGPTPLGQGGLA